MSLYFSGKTKYALYSRANTPALTKLLIGKCSLLNPASKWDKRGVAGRDAELQPACVRPTYSSTALTRGFGDPRCVI